MKKMIATTLVALALVPAMGAEAARRPQTMADVMKARVVREARAYGFDAKAVLQSRQTVFITGRDGTTITRSMRTIDAIRHLAANIVMPKSDGRRAAAQPGPGGTPEINVGDLVHAYVTVGRNAPFAYSITESAVVPATPPVTATMPLFFEAGGPLTQIKGGNWTIGGHGVGTTIGSNIDTGAGGPYLPVVNTAAVFDSSIDFIGHADALQVRICFFGICFATIGVMVGDGVTLFDNKTAVSFPIVP